MTLSKLKGKTFFPILVLIFLSIIWGISFLLIKKGLLAFSPMQVAALRIVFASAVLFPIAIKHINIEFKIYWKQIIFLGLISNLIPAILFAEAQTKINSSLAGMLNSLVPIFTMIIGVLFYKIKINFLLSMGLLIGLIGSVVLSFVSSEGNLGVFNFYALYVIMATILYGISGNMIKGMVQKIRPTILISLQLLAMSPIAIIILINTNIYSSVVTNENAMFSLGSLFILGAIGTALAGSIFINLVKHTSALFASATTYLIPITAIIVGLLDDEVLFPLHFVGIGLIIVGVIIINKFR
ncbi:MAG: DMT family transporter [Melioribacteraceae bacterium]